MWFSWVCCAWDTQQLGLWLQSRHLFSWCHHVHTADKQVRVQRKRLQRNSEEEQAMLGLLSSKALGEHQWRSERPLFKDAPEASREQDLSIWSTCPQMVLNVDWQFLIRCWHKRSERNRSWPDEIQRERRLQFSEFRIDERSKCTCVGIREHYWPDDFKSNHEQEEDAQQYLGTQCWKR